jgi:hypothetical protein
VYKIETRRAAYYAEHSALFQEACALAGVAPTKRQAAKWRRKTGKAWEAYQETPGLQRLNREPKS